MVTLSISILGHCEERSDEAISKRARDRLRNLIELNKKPCHTMTENRKIPHSFFYGGFNDSIVPCPFDLRLAKIGNYMKYQDVSVKICFRVYTLTV